METTINEPLVVDEVIPIDRVKFVCSIIAAVVIISLVLFATGGYFGWVYIDYVMFFHGVGGFTTCNFIWWIVQDLLVLFLSGSAIWFAIVQSINSYKETYQS